MGKAARKPMAAPKGFIVLHNDRSSLVPFPGEEVLVNAKQVQLVRPSLRTDEPSLTGSQIVIGGTTELVSESPSQVAELIRLAIGLRQS